MPTRAELKMKAKEQIKGNIAILFAILLIYTLVSTAVSFIPFLGAIAVIITAGPICLSFTMIFLGLTKGKKPELANLFDGFQNFGKSLALLLLMMLFTWLWSLLFLIPGIIKGISYSQCFYILAQNPNLTAREALKESIKIMDGHKMEYFVLNLSFILWGLLTTVTFGLAGIYVYPYMEATLTNYYLALVGGETANVSVKPAMDELKEAEAELEEMAKKAEKTDDKDPGIFIDEKK